MWVARLQSSDATNEDRRAFERWLTANPSHGPAYEEFRGLWADLRDVPIAPDRLEKLQRARRRAVSGGITTLLIAVAVSASFWRMGYVDRWQSDYYTAVGEVRSIILEDGTSVALNTDTAIAVRYSAGERRIELLRGEAFFDVAKNPARPFVVDDGALTARAVGTGYAVRTADGRFLAEVRVEEGRVEVAAPDDSALLDAGDVATLTGRGEWQVRRKDVASETAWRDGKLVFSERPLGEVLATLERYRQGRILVLDDAAARRMVSGVFDLNDTDRVLDALAETLPVTVTRFTGMVVLVQSR